MRIALRLAALLGLALATGASVPSAANADWRDHAQRRYFVTNGDGYREVARATFAAYRSTCSPLEIKEYPALKRINYICYL